MLFFFFIDEQDMRFKQDLEVLQWNPLLAPPSTEMEVFISMTKAVGLYARACDTTNSQPLLLTSAAASSRDITLQYAHDILFQAGYDTKKAMSLLVPGTLLRFNINFCCWAMGKNLE